MKYISRNDFKLQSTLFLYMETPTGIESTEKESTFESKSKRLIEDVFTNRYRSRYNNVPNKESELKERVNHTFTCIEKMAAHIVDSEERESFIQEELQTVLARIQIPKIKEEKIHPIRQEVLQNFESLPKEPSDKDYFNAFEKTNYGFPIEECEEHYQEGDSAINAIKRRANDSEAGNSRVKINSVIESNSELKKAYEKTIQSIREEYEYIKDAIGLKDSQFGQSDSWIHVDVLKQLAYLYDPKLPAHREYNVDNPLTNKRVQQDIVERHIGWEICDILHSPGIIKESIHAWTTTINNADASTTPEELAELKQWLKDDQESLESIPKIPYITNNTKLTKQLTDFIKKNTREDRQSHLLSSLHYQQLGKQIGSKLQKKRAKQPSIFRDLSHLQYGDVCKIESPESYIQTFIDQHYIFKKADTDTFGPNSIEVWKKLPNGTEKKISIVPNGIQSLHPQYDKNNNVIGILTIDNDGDVALRTGNEMSSMVQPDNSQDDLYSNTWHFENNNVRDQSTAFSSSVNSVLNENTVDENPEVIPADNTPQEEPEPEYGPVIDVETTEQAFEQTQNKEKKLKKKNKKLKKKLKELTKKKKTPNIVINNITINNNQTSDKEQARQPSPVEQDPQKKDPENHEYTHHSDAFGTTGLDVIQTKDISNEEYEHLKSMFYRKVIDNNTRAGNLGGQSESKKMIEGKKIIFTKNDKEITKNEHNPNIFVFHVKKEVIPEDFRIDNNSSNIGEFLSKIHTSTTKKSVTNILSE